VLLFITYGGQAGVPSITRFAQQRLPELGDKYRFVMLDQRGTGGSGAVDCPGLQSSSNSNEIPAPPAAVVSCGQSLGARAGLYSTDQTVADLDALREALGAPKMVVDGISYGTFVAERYAVAHPDRVSKLVLDEPLPHTLTVPGSLYLQGWSAQATVLRTVCATAPACGYDPAQDVATLVRENSVQDNLKLANTISIYGVVDPTYRNPNAFGAGFGDLPTVLHAAAQGDTARLATVEAAFLGPKSPYTTYSAGGAVSILCTDQRQPWGNSATPSPLRQFALDVTQRLITPQSVWPYTPEVAVNPGFIKTCQSWPAVAPTSNPDVPLPNIPILMLSGSTDLLIPTVFARQELQHAPSAKLVIVPDVSGPTQDYESGHVGRDAVDAFLL